MTILSAVGFRSSTFIMLDLMTSYGRLIYVIKSLRLKDQLISTWIISFPMRHYNSYLRQFYQVFCLSVPWFAKKVQA